LVEHRHGNPLLSELVPAKQQRIPPRVSFVEKGGIEVHLVKEGRVIGKDSRSQTSSEFTKMLRLLESERGCRVVLVEKTDRLYRDRTDVLGFEEFGQEREDYSIPAQRKLLARNMLAVGVFPLRVSSSMWSRPKSWPKTCTTLTWRSPSTTWKT
jgi:hypothetical protein